jgi:hypothetical protein
MRDIYRFSFQFDGDNELLELGNLNFVSRHTLTYAIYRHRTKYRLYVKNKHGVGANVNVTGIYDKLKVVQTQNSGNCAQKWITGVELLIYTT